MMDDSGDSVSVSKRCATLADCQFTGCAQVAHNGYQVCRGPELGAPPLVPLSQRLPFAPSPGVLVLLRGEHLQRAGAEEREQRHLLLHLSPGRLGREAPPCGAGLHHQHQRRLLSWTRLSSY